MLGREAYVNIFSIHFASEGAQLACLILSPAIGAVVGVLLAALAQSFFEYELQLVEDSIENLAPVQIAGGAIGLIAGLVIAFLMKNILFEFVTVAGKAGSYVAIVLYLIVAVFAAYLGARVGAKMRIVPLAGVGALGSGQPKVVDTSAIVDGRISEIVRAGFLEGPLVIPRFVLRELQSIADSTDPIKRMRGRRGLDVLAKLQELTKLDISERDFDDPARGGVDAKLVLLAREIGAKLVTTDYNLNRVAHVEGVSTLNINELLNAVKSVVVPGDELSVQVIREGKEANQGVAYMDDGTMIVVEQGRRFVGGSAEVVVTSVLQTSAGRMIFAKPRREGVA